MKQHTGYVSSTLYEDGHDILNVYKDNIQIDMTRIHCYNKRRYIYEECESEILYGILCSLCHFM